MRKTYGNTWWGKEWLNALTAIDYSNRLPRGRTYANKGAVLNITIEGNHIGATVAGSRRNAYRVDIYVPPFDSEDQAKIIELITSNPFYLSQLLNRNLPPDLNDYLNEQGIALFPTSWEDLQGECSCPDWAVPCKHMAAVLYLIANEIDKNPFLVFELHNFDLFDGLANTGFIGSDQKEIPVTNVDDLIQPFDIEPKDFDWKEEVYQTLDFTRLPDCLDNLMQLLSDKPVFYPSGDFKPILHKVYQNTARNLRKAELKRELPEKLLAEHLAVEEVAMITDEAFNFLYCTLRNNKGDDILIFQHLEDLMEWLKKIPPAALLQLSNHLRGLFLAYQYALKLAIHSAITPELLQIGIQHYRIRWIPLVINEDINQLNEKLKQLIPTDLVFVKVGKEIFEPIESETLNSSLSVFLNHFIQKQPQTNLRMLENQVTQLFFNGSLEKFEAYESQGYPAAIQLWLNKFYLTEKDFIPVLLVEDQPEENSFVVDVAVEDKKQALQTLISLPELFEETQYRNIRMDALRDLTMLAEHFPQIQTLIASKGQELLHFDSEKFVAVLFKILPTIRLFGIKVLLPKALRKLLRPQLSLTLESEEGGAINKKSLLSLDQLINFNWQVAIGDHLVPASQFEQMIQQYSGIVLINDQYVHFNEEDIKKLIQQMRNPPQLNSQELLQVALTEEYEGAHVQLDETTKELIDNLLNGEAVKPPRQLRATLRPYQLRGYQWLYKNTRIGFGSLIADDMGLGKTLQVIATLLKLKEDGELDQRKALIIVPTTLLTNWSKEIAKFAPALHPHLYHGPKRDLAPLQTADLLITTYGVARSDSHQLSKLPWLLLAIDEAQNIKNPSTAQTKAIKKIKAAVKIAMSGTPVENRLSEYWSIFDFSNKGYLGGLKAFKDNYARPIEVDRNQQQLKRFRKITSPFILRRVKTDKSIIKDLPDKIEQDQFCQLTSKQAALYQSVVDNTMRQIETAEGIARKGLVLKLITALKQVCNHPRQFLKKGKADAAFSGKCMLLIDLMQPILNNGEKVLIFTQYQEMGRLLAEMLEEHFGLATPFLHGGVPRKKRDEMVEQFQNDRATRALLLSLKAGGTGLNLTAASNVIHFDLWWNPAVEAQATDRAYRIGQKRNVLVHRFITQGTFEEKINTMLLKKKELADLTVSNGEQWIGDFSDGELRELVALGKAD
ncbi:MAG: DEAD/DEAH box helicase [Bacteroidota bacterium]